MERETGTGFGLGRLRRFAQPLADFRRGESLHRQFGNESGAFQRGLMIGGGGRSAVGVADARLKLLPQVAGVFPLRRWTSGGRQRLSALDFPLAAAGAVPGDFQPQYPDHIE